LSALYFERLSILLLYSNYNRNLLKSTKLVFYLQYDKVYNKSYDTKTVRKVMKLNGKSKKSTKVKSKNSEKANNAKGYSLIENRSEYDYDSESGYVKYYLKTPSKKVFVARVYEDYY